MVVIRCVGKANGQKSEDDNCFIRDANVNANHGLGSVQLTPYLPWAKRFENHASAKEFWEQQSTLRPLRDDGRPNRPLTAYTILIEEIVEKK